MECKKLLNINYETLTRDELLATIKEITMRLHTHFRKHIGFEQACYPAQIFEASLSVNAEELSIYEREYWWNIIKKVMKNLRSSEQLFVIHRGNKWFVLFNTQEAKQYCGMLDNTITALGNSQKKARKWVRNQSWRNI